MSRRRVAVGVGSEAGGRGVSYRSSLVDSERSDKARRDTSGILDTLANPMKTPPLPMLTLLEPDM